MKKVFVMAFCLLLLAGLYACGGGGSEPLPSGPPPTDTAKAQVTGRVVLSSGSTATVFLYATGIDPVTSMEAGADGSFTLLYTPVAGQYYKVVVVANMGTPNERAYGYYMYSKDGTYFSNLVKPSAGTTVVLGDLTLNAATGQALSSLRIPLDTPGVSEVVFPGTPGNWIGTITVVSATSACSHKPGDTYSFPFTIDPYNVNAVTMRVGGNTFAGTVDGTLLAVSSYVANPTSPYVARFRNVAGGTVINTGKFEQVGSAGSCSMDGTFTAQKQ